MLSQQSYADEYALNIKVDSLYKHVATLSSPQMEGRRVGQAGGALAREYLVREFEKMGLEKPFSTGYVQNFDTMRARGANIIGMIRGMDLKDEAIVIMAHYDFIGTANGTVYSGAEDNASGVSALLEIARTFKLAGQREMIPRRSIIFALFDGNKAELAGSSYYMNHSVIPPEKTILALNMDMIGRVDGYAEGENDYVFILGADRISSDLQHITDSINNAAIQLIVDYKFYNNDMLFKLFYPMSDHYVFDKRYIPTMYYTSGIIADIHSPEDKIEKLYFPSLMRRTRLVFETAWYYAMSGAWPKLDFPMKSKAEPEKSTSPARKYRKR